MTQQPATSHTGQRPFAVCSRSLCARVISGGAGGVPARALAGDSDVFCLGALLALGEVELDLLPFLQAAVAVTGDRAEVHEHVRAVLDRDETVAFVAVEPLHSALRHLDLLGCARGAPPWLGAALATCPWPACHGTPGGWNRNAGTGLGETGTAVTHPRGQAHPDRIRTSGLPDPARRTARIQQPVSGKARAHQIVWETGGDQPFAAGAGKPARYLDDLAPGGVRAAPDSA